MNHKLGLPRVARCGLLLTRHTGKPTRIHEGKIITLKSDLRWCSDAFVVRRWNGERVQVVFSSDCCDREVMAYAATTGAIAARWFGTS